MERFAAAGGKRFLNSLLKRGDGSPKSENSVIYSFGYKRSSKYLSEIFTDLEQLKGK